jgi:putative transposase
VVDAQENLGPLIVDPMRLKQILLNLLSKGISTGDFEEALLALLGQDAGGPSAATISRLKEGLVARARALEQARSLGHVAPRLA